MNRRKLFFLYHIAVASMGSMVMADYLYPVASVSLENENHRLFLLQQRSIENIKLWLWNPGTKQAQEVVSSSLFTCANIQILPGQDTFSFIDNGTIYTEYFNLKSGALKRYPRRIDMYTSVYDINNIEWVDDYSFYFVAKKRDRYGIFHSDINGEVIPLLCDGKTDYISCQKVGADFFFIQKSVGIHQQFTIAHTIYPTLSFDEENNFNSTKDFAQRVDAVLGKKEHKDSLIQESSVIFSCKYPIRFLRMISAEYGFFIEHPAAIDSYDKMISFVCHIVYKNSCGQWTEKTAFTFSLPTYLLLSTKDRLYEGIVPLLPYYNNGKLYYVDLAPQHMASEQEGHQALNLFSYALDTGCITSKTNNEFGLSLSIVACGENRLYYGGTLEKNVECQQQPCMWIDSEGSVCFDLPRIDEGEFWV